MAIDVNGYNETFKAFADFAKVMVDGRGNAKSIARVTTGVNIAEGALAGRTITAATTDKVFKFFRSNDDKEANNTTREIFRNAIIDMFGGESKIPASVKKAMLMADYGKGKPLTARRILAVKVAIDSHVSQINDKAAACIEECRKKFSSKRIGQAEKLLAPAFDACKGNFDAMEILQKKISKFVYTSTSDFRTVEDVQAKVTALVANLDELKEAAKNDPGIYAAGKDMLMNLGKPIPKGLFGNLVKAANRMSLNQLQNLSGSASGISINKAVMQLYGEVQRAITAAGAENVLEGSEEVMCARSFLVEAAISHCSKGTLGKIRAALNSETTTHLVGFYQQCRSDDNSPVKNESKTLQKGVVDIGIIGDTYLRLLDEGVNWNTKRLNPAAQNTFVPYAKGLPDMEAIGGDQLIADTIDMAKHLDADRKVCGEGRGAEAIKNVMRGLEGADDVAQNIAQRLNRNANAMMNWSFCAEMKKNGVGTQFEKDIYRGCNATLTDGKKTIKLTQNFETARNELAQFVTGDDNATYGNLKPEDKTKVHMLMSLISQETEKAGEDGTKHAMDKRESDAGFQFEGYSKRDRANGIGSPAERTYVIEKRADGGIDLHYNMDKPIKNIDDLTTDGDGYDVGAGSKFMCKMDYTLKGDEFNRLAKLDYGKFDDSEGYKIFNRKVDMSDGTRQFREKKLEKVVDSFAQEFKVNADCNMDFALVLYPAENE